MIRHAALLAAALFAAAAAGRAEPGPAAATGCVAAAVRACAIALHASDLLAQDRTAEAELGFARALADAPDDDSRAFVRRTASDAYYQRGAGHASRQEWDPAIADYTAALRYGPGAAVYRERGDAYLRKVDLPAAIADYTAAIGDGQDASSGLYQARGEAREMALDFEGAAQDYADTIRVAPGDGAAYNKRGRAYVVLGRLAEGRADLEKALDMLPHDASTIVWLHILHLRLGEDDAVWLAAQYDAMHTHDVWPAPAIGYFLGRTPADEIVRFAQTDSKAAAAYQTCDGWFYMGQQALARGDTAGAVALFRKTIDSCDALDYEWDAAQMELKRLAAR